MKKSIAVPLGFAASLLFTATAFAQEPNQTLGSLCAPGFEALCVGPEGIGPLLGNVVAFIFVLAIIIAFVFLIYGGLKWIVSGGDKGKVEEARSTIIAAVIGLIVTFLSYLILTFVLGLFGLDLINLSFPQITGSDSSDRPRGDGTSCLGQIGVCTRPLTPVCIDSQWQCVQP